MIFGILKFEIRTKRTKISKTFYNFSFLRILKWIIICKTYLRLIGGKYIDGGLEYPPTPVGGMLTPCKVFHKVNKTHFLRGFPKQSSRGGRIPAYVFITKFWRIFAIFVCKFLYFSALAVEIKLHLLANVDWLMYWSYAKNVLRLCHKKKKSYNCLYLRVIGQDFKIQVTELIRNRQRYKYTYIKIEKVIDE